MPDQQPTGLQSQKDIGEPQQIGNFWLGQVGLKFSVIIFTPVGTSNAEKPKWRKMSHVPTILTGKQKEDLSQAAAAWLAFPKVPLPSVTARSP